MEKQKKHSRRAIVRIIGITACLAVFLFALYNMISIIQNYREIDRTYDAATEQFTEIPVPPDIGSQTGGEDNTGVPEVDFEGLLAVNDDIIGWIYIENTAECDLKVGCYDLKPDCGVSMGTFLLSRSDGGGLYYNVEAYCANKWGLKNKSWLKTELTKKQLIKVSDRIKQWNYWDLYFNCTFFAAEIWNCASKKKIIPLMFPFFIKWQILAKGGNKDVEMKPVEKTDCFKQRGSGKNAHIVQVKEGTLDSKLF